MNGSWQHRAADHLIEIALTQDQPGDPFRLPIEIGITIEGSAQPRIEKFEMTERQQRFSIKADKAPTSVGARPELLGPHEIAVCAEIGQRRSLRDDPEDLRGRLHSFPWRE